MTGSKMKTDEQMVVVDARKLAHGLKATFEGVAMVFECLGVDSGIGTAGIGTAGIGTAGLGTDGMEQKAGKKNVEDEVTEKTVQEEKKKNEDTGYNAAGENHAAPDDGVHVADGNGKAGETTDSDSVAEQDLEQRAAPKPVIATVTLDDITKIIVQKIKKNRSNNQRIGQILKTYGVGKVGELDPKTYEAFLTDLAGL